VIRVASVEDASAISELLAQLGYPSSTTQVERRIRDTVASTEGIVFVAAAGSQVIGLLSLHCIPLFHAEGSLARITSLIVAPEHRRSGVGRALIAAAEEFAWTHNCIRVEVTSGDHRVDAHAFYEDLDYQRDSRRFIKHRRHA
jgi:GNAT superfamily N-acetyltransferase